MQNNESEISISIGQREAPSEKAEIRPVNFSSGNQLAIRLEDVWKQYRLGVINHGTLARDLQSWWAKKRGREDPNLRVDQCAKGPISSQVDSPDIGTGDRFWALRGISFDVQQGDVFGIIGRNGAGKSTLLKILSKVTAPTRGQLRFKGRIASLLEVGTGFHPELTGRENVFLNGAILGMNKHEIRNKFDEIIAFAELEKFIDTPVKRYSSGMYVRLAFAVAAHLEPEILIVDEVLAVGDVQFQKKCLGKMEAVGREGRTVLFVSHNMAAIQQLTNKCLLLHHGQLAYFGDVSGGVAEYQSIGLDNSQFEAINPQTKLEGFNIARACFEIDKLASGFNKPLSFSLFLDLERGFEEVSIGFGINNSLGARVVTFEENFDSLAKGRVSIEFTLADHHLPPGNYSVALGIGVRGAQVIYQDSLLSMEIFEQEIDSIYLGGKKDRIGAFYRPDFKLSNW